MSLHPLTVSKVPAQLAHPSRPDCTFGQTPMDSPSASPWPCRNSSSPWTPEANFQGPMSVVPFLRPAGASTGEGELEEWEVLYPDGGRLGLELK